MFNFYVSYFVFIQTFEYLVGIQLFVDYVFG